MARLDKDSRHAISKALQTRVPPHWRVVVGADGCAFIELDQDGRKPPNQFPSTGSTVLRVTNAGDGSVVVERFRRVPCPPGYVEAREPIGIVCVVSGRKWREEVVEAMVSSVLDADAVMSGIMGEA